jgi:glucose/mannose-6-phosphate isomerase
MGLLAGVLERAGVLTLDADEIKAGVIAARETSARCAPAVPTAGNPAKQLAWALVDRYAIITGSGFLAPVARRWKAQLNENSKATAGFDELPEATHNTVVGFEQPESLRDHLFVVFLASSLDHPRNALRAKLIREILETGKIGHQVVEASGEGRLGQALSAITIGDHVSVYLAFAYAVDPTPVTAIEHIKDQLAMADQEAVEVDS